MDDSQGQPEPPGGKSGEDIDVATLNERLVELRRRRDPEENARTAPPEGELVAWRALWLAEVFTLSMVDDLAAALQSLQPPERAGFASQDLSRAIETLVGAPSIRVGGHSWIPLGSIGRSLTPLRGDPPAGVKSVTLDLHIPLPSVFVLVAMFEFDDELLAEPQRLLEAEWATELNDHDGLLSPQFRKRREIRLLRFNRKRECARWLANDLHLAGVFATSQVDGGRYPATEWWTTRVAAPLAGESGVDPHDYLDAIRLFHRVPGQWISSELGGQRFDFADSDEPNVRDSEVSYALLVAGREDELFEGDDLKFYGGDEDGRVRATLNRMTIDVSCVTSVWALDRLHRLYERQIADLRNELLALRGGPVSRRVERLETIEDGRIGMVGDLVPFLRDVVSGADAIERSARVYSGITLDPNPQYFERRKGEQSTEDEWVKLVRQDLPKRAERLLEREETLRDLATTVSATLNARLNARLQERILYRLGRSS